VGADGAGSGIPTRPRAMRPSTSGKYRLGNADLCGWCWEHQLAWHKKIGQEIGESDPPKPGEREGVYWHRVGGKFLDTYIEACREAFKAARK